MNLEAVGLHTLAYGSIANVLDVTIVVIPITVANEDLDPFDYSYKPRDSVNYKNWCVCK